MTLPSRSWLLAVLLGLPLFATECHDPSVPEFSQALANSAVIESLTSMGSCTRSG